MIIFGSTAAAEPEPVVSSARIGHGGQVGHWIEVVASALVMYFGQIGGFGTEIGGTVELDVDGGTGGLQKVLPGQQGAVMQTMVPGGDGSMVIGGVVEDDVVGKWQRRINHGSMVILLESWTPEA